MVLDKKHNPKELTIFLWALLLLLTDLYVKITAIYDNMGCDKFNTLKFLIFFLFEAAFLKSQKLYFWKEDQYVYIHKQIC